MAHSVDVASRHVLCTANGRYVRRRKYLTDLLEYLRGFHQRTQPLQSLAKQLARLEQEFDAQWEAGTVPGWSAGEQVSPSP